MNYQSKLPFKSIYTHFYKRSGIKYPLPNGLHPNLLSFLKDNLELNTDASIEDYETGRFPFNHGDFYHYFQKLCGEESNIFLDEIETSLDENFIYIFPLEVRTTLESVRSDIICEFNNKTHVYNVIASLPDKIIDLLQKKKIYLLLTLIHDPVYEEDVLNTAYSLQQHGIESDRVHIISARSGKIDTCDAKMYRGIIPLTKVANEIGYPPKIGGLGYLSEYMDVSDLDSSILRSKKFISFNRSARNHRIWLLNMLAKYNLLDEGYFSFIFPHVPSGMIAPELLQVLPYELDTHHLSIKEKGEFATNNNNKKLYKDSYIHIVTETSFQEPNVCFTEKIFRPIANLQPFIVIGNSFSLKELRELGFKTFHPFINEEYDTVIDSSRRLTLIEEELLRLSKMNLREVHTLYYSLRNILIHNKNHLVTYKDDNPFHIPLQNMKTTILRG